MPSNREPSPPTILLVDDDLGFVVWLGQTLASNGYLTVPAAGGQQAKQVMEELGIKICLAIVNLALPGVSDLVEMLQQRDPSIKVIAIRVTGSGITPTTKIDAAHSRSQSGWLGMVRQILGNGRAANAR